MNWQQVCAIGRAFPEVTIESWYGTPSLKVRGKGFVRLKEDGKSVVFITENTDEQEALIDAKPAVYYITDHYRGWNAVLARLSALTAAECRTRVERAWRVKAPTSLVRAFDAVPATQRHRKKPAARSRHKAKPTKAKASK